jgi:hypothetical protein
MQTPHHGKGNALVVVLEPGEHKATITSNAAWAERRSEGDVPMSDRKEAVLLGPCFAQEDEGGCEDVPGHS